MPDLETVEGLITGNYDSGLVLISFIVAVFAAFTALHLSSHIDNIKDRGTKLRIAGCAITMGGGIWSMHFIGMLAFQLPVTVSYDVLPTLLSSVVAVLASGVAFYFTNATKPYKWRITIGGLIMGLGISGMHYIGMAGMRIPATIHYVTSLVILSIFIAISASIISLWLTKILSETRFKNHNLIRLVSAIVMGIAIAGMHYTGIAAAVFEQTENILAQQQGLLNKELLAYAISIVTVLILVMAVIASSANKRFAILNELKDELEIRVQERTKDLNLINERLKQEIRERGIVQTALERAHDELEKRVKERTAELERSNEELESFAYIASHDLKEPLRKIIAFSDRLKRKIPDISEEATAYLDRLDNAANRMMILIDSLLELSKVSTKKGYLEIVDLRQVVKEVEKDLEIQLVSMKGSINIGYMPSLEADPLQMRQLFQNIIGNSLKYRRQGVPPVVDVESSLNDTGNWWITIKDNGIGFDEKYAERIFRPFERLHGRSSYEGTGIGLAICEKIVNRHSGHISIQSQPGSGSSFTIILPQSQPTEQELNDAPNVAYK